MNNGTHHYRKATIMGDLQKTLQNRAAALQEQQAKEKSKKLLQL